MDFGLSDEQRQLKESARVFLTGECSTSAVREAMADNEGAAHELYSQIAALGWTGLIVPESFGGAGLGMLDMSLVLEECGYAAMPGPFLFSSVPATAALVSGGSAELSQRWLGPMARGEALGTIAIVENNDSLNPASFATSARRDGTRWILNGTKVFVPYVHTANFIVVAGRTGTRATDVELFVVETNSPGVKLRRLKNLDLTRRVCAMELDAVAVSEENRLEGGAELLHRVIDLGAIAMAADSLGGTERVLAMAVDYSKIREQFGRPIGSFQALQHAAAEIAAELEPARALVWYAAYAQDALPREAPRAAAMAKARMCEVYMRSADRAVLMHGGIGFTWEHDIHIWFKRARFNEAYLGAPPYHRERVASLSGY